jgi:cytochrome c-type biogenesis protein CcmH
MRIAWLPAALLLGFSIGAFAQTEGFDDPELDARYRELIHTLRCMQCQNQSIADSPAATAVDLRRQTRELMLEGLSDNEIRLYFAERYGDFINYQPPFKPSTWLLWLAPAILVAGGGFVFARIIRARMQQPLDEELEG